MVNTVYIVWCKTNKHTPKFDIGVYVTKDMAEIVKDNHKEDMAEIWITEYKLK